MPRKTVMATLALNFDYLAGLSGVPGAGLLPLGDIRDILINKFFIIPDDSFK